MGEYLLRTAAHLSKKVNASFQILLIANQVSISSLGFLLFSSWFGTVFKLSKLDTSFKTDGRLFE